MLDKFDYAEPNCPLCDGKDFYYPKKDAPLGKIPVDRIIDKVDSLFNKNDYEEAGRLLEYWKNEAVSLKDKRGQLSIENELIGYYRKQNNRESALKSVLNAINLVKELGQENMASGATVYLNCATAYKAFGMPSEAMPLYIKAEEIYKNELSSFDSRFGGLYNNMALALCDLGRFDEAEEKYLNAVKVMEKVQNGELECAITYINMAHMCEEAGKPEKIGGHMENAYALLKSEGLPRDGYYAFVLEKCAPSFEYFGNKKLCEEMLKEAEEIYERN